MLETGLIVKAIGELGGYATVHDVAWWLNQNNYWQDDYNAQIVSQRLSQLVARKHLVKSPKLKYPVHTPPFETARKMQLTVYALLGSSENRLASCAVLTTTNEFSEAYLMQLAIPKSVRLCVYLLDDPVAERAAWGLLNTIKVGVDKITMAGLDSLRAKYGSIWFTSKRLEQTYYDLLAKRRKRKNVQ